MESCYNLCPVTEENLQDGTTSVLKDSTNSCASLVSDYDDDDDDNHKPLAKKWQLSDPEIEELIMGADKYIL